jgi:16S rRNA G966 N2-methylase RsmD
MGSKSQIAEKIIHYLPAGSRLVDLFGGGGAISHCAVLSNKWDTVTYNEINPGVCKLFRDCIEGKYTPGKFVPSWVSREDFAANKDTDAYIKYFWSFGNGGGSYLYGLDIEDDIRILHKAVVFNDLSEINKVFPAFKGFPAWFKTIEQRRVYMRQYAIRNNQLQLKQLAVAERLNRLCHLEGLQRALIPLGDKQHKLTINNQSYKDVAITDDDIIYCDPPYVNTRQYTKETFDTAAFWDWVRECSSCVIVSEYNAPPDIIEIANNPKVSLFSAEKRVVKSEKMFWNGKGDLNTGNLFQCM